MKGDKSGAIDIPIATFVPEEDIGDKFAAFPFMLLKLLLVCDGVAVAASAALTFISMADIFIALAYDGATLGHAIAISEIALYSLSIVASILALVFACTMHSKTSKSEYKQSTQQMMRTHVAIFVIDAVVFLFSLTGIVAFIEFFLIVLYFMAPIWITITSLSLLSLSYLALRVTCFVLAIRLYKKIKSADNEAVESSAAQSLIEKDGIEIV